ncbi:hypothetical protein V6N13_149369 [Hibiscus sabdariffa]|uniref:Cytochrome P450 n=1 Tax=Hibiscus sabdariffa TaxID=183260 RepID=A0ABR2EHJ0_9ROSI
MINPTANLTSSYSVSDDTFVSRPLVFLQYFQVLELILAGLVFVVIHSLRRKRHNGLPVWPLLGVLPSLVIGLRSDLYEWISDILCRHNRTFMFEGPWFSSLKCVVTSDPRNLEHLFKTKFSVFPKGSYFRDTVRDLLGDGIFNADDERWQRQRKKASIEFHSAKFRQLTTESLLELVHARLLLVLENSVNNSTSIDLQDVLLRLTFDNVCMIAFGVDLGCLRPGLPVIPFARAFEDATDATLLRFVTPACRDGTEMKLKRLIKGVDEFAEQFIKTRKKELSLQTEDKKQRSDLLTVFMRLKDEQGKPFPDKFLRDISVNFILCNLRHG